VKPDNVVHLEERANKKKKRRVGVPVCAQRKEIGQKKKKTSFRTIKCADWAKRMKDTESVKLK